MTEKWEYGDPCKVALMREKKQLGCWACQFHKRKKKILAPNEPKMNCTLGQNGYPFLDKFTCKQYKVKHQK